MLVQDRKARATPHPDVVTTLLPNGEMVLLHLATRQYYSLNGTGALIWQLMKPPSTLEQIGEALHSRFDLTPEAAIENVLELMQDLGAHKLVTIEES